jgi:D-alanyl-lipoteichoic acid acyltransferase DltB (MBOAT superfamily)
MTFNSIQYALFAPAVLLLYRRLPFRAQNVMLLIVSYIFYGWWNWIFLGLLMFSTVIDFVVAKRIHDSDDDRVRKRWLVAAISVQIGILAFFKYAGFFAESANAALQRLGLEGNIHVLRILLPVGISFYTFHTISYTFDVYRRRMEPTDNFVDFALFVAFFPQLVAGPIARARMLLPQLARPRRNPSSVQYQSAIALILFGLFKKVALADAVAPVVDTMFAAKTPTLLTTVIGAWGFAVQIYADFSGYTDIARGTSRLFGIELMRNFEQPYLSRNITEFWRTWHISLSTWLRDYLYIPLGGNQGGRFATYRNLFITMLLGGLWHGAALTFIVWGGIHGVLLAAHRAFRPRASLAAMLPEIRWRDAVKIFVTFNVVSLAWIFFRAQSIGEALDVTSGIFRLSSAGATADSMIIVFGALAIVFLTDIAQRNIGALRVVVTMHPLVRAGAYAAMILAILIWSGGTARPFIYFQF